MSIPSIPRLLGERTDEGCAKLLATVLLGVYRSVKSRSGFSRGGGTTGCTAGADVVQLSTDSALDLTSGQVLMYV